MKYNIAAKPTIYKSILYRSRLEATWACFFDKCGIQYEYEPFDLPGWSPDFQLQAYGHDDVLVEVKPVIVFPHEVIAKITKALRKAECDSNVFLLGTGILASEDGSSPVLGIRLVIEQPRRKELFPAYIEHLKHTSGVNVEKAWALAKNELQFLKPGTVH